MLRLMIWIHRNTMKANWGPSSQVRLKISICNHQPLVYMLIVPQSVKLVEFVSCSRDSRMVPMTVTPMKAQPGFAGNRILPAVLALMLKINSFTYSLEQLRSTNWAGIIQDSCSLWPPGILDTLLHGREESRAPSRAWSKWSAKRSIYDSCRMEAEIHKLNSFQSRQEWNPPSFRTIFRAQLGDVPYRNSHPHGRLEWIGSAIRASFFMLFLCLSLCLYHPSHHRSGDLQRQESTMSTWIPIFQCLLGSVYESHRPLGHIARCTLLWVCRHGSKVSRRKNNQSVFGCQAQQTVII